MEWIDGQLEGAVTVGITGHVRPDGDCTGATLGLYNYIRENYPDIRADVFLEPIEKHFRFLAGSSDIRSKADTDVQYDVFFVLDCKDMERMAPFTHEYIKNAKNTVCIDHHVTGSWQADENHVEPDVSSSCQVLYELLDKKKISKSVAECLYVGIIHDTGVFKYQSVTARTMEIAGVLMSTGIDFTSIIDDTFFRKSYAQNRLMGYALMESRRILDDRLIYSYITTATLNDFGVAGRDTGGIIDQLRFTEGVEVALFMYDLPDGKIKASLRSVHDIDVNAVANHFGGGGHLRAAGFTTLLPADEIIKGVAELVAQQL